MLKRLAVFSISCFLSSIPLYAKLVMVKKLTVNSQYCIQQQSDKLVITDNDTGNIITIDKTGKIRASLGDIQPALASLLGRQLGGGFPMALGFEDDSVTVYSNARVFRSERLIQVSAGTSITYKQGIPGGPSIGVMSVSSTDDFLAVDSNFEIKPGLGDDSYRFVQAENGPFDQEEVLLYTSKKYEKLTRIEKVAPDGKEATKDSQEQLRQAREKARQLAELERQQRENERQQREIERQRRENERQQREIERQQRDAAINKYLTDKYFPGGTMGLQMATRMSTVNNTIHYSCSLMSGIDSEGREKTFYNVSETFQLE